MAHCFIAIESGWAPATMRICYSGIKFFFKNVTKREWHLLALAQAKRERRLPAVLSRDEVKKILTKVDAFHNYVYLMTVYSCGLRLQEGLYLEVSDIDGERKMIHVHRGKGAKDFAKFKHRVRELTGRSWFVSMEHRYKKLAEYLRGWVGYFGISEAYRPIPEIYHWLRWRIRMCYWKQWRRCRTKVSNLLRLGTFLKTAIAAGMSRKGPWRLSRTFLASGLFASASNKDRVGQGPLSPFPP